MKKQTAPKPTRLSHKTIKIPPPPTPEEEWTSFGQRLAQTIADMDEDEFLIIEEKKRLVYAQFSAQGFFGMRVETVSPAFCKIEPSLSKTNFATLRKLGWKDPTYIHKSGQPEPTKGSCNYYIDTGFPVPFSDVAELVVRTLRDVYRTRYPGALRYCAFASNDTYKIRFSSLGLKRRDEWQKTE